MEFHIAYMCKMRSEQQFWMEQLIHLGILELHIYVHLFISRFVVAVACSDI